MTPRVKTTRNGAGPLSTYASVAQWRYAIFGLGPFLDLRHAIDWREDLLHIPSSLEHPSPRWREYPVQEYHQGAGSPLICAIMQRCGWPQWTHTNLGLAPYGFNLLWGCVLVEPCNCGAGSPLNVCNCGAGSPFGAMQLWGWVPCGAMSLWG